MRAGSSGKEMETPNRDFKERKNLKESNLRGRETRPQIHKKKTKRKKAQKKNEDFLVPHLEKTSHKKKKKPTGRDINGGWGGLRGKNCARKRRGFAKNMVGRFR